MGLALVRAQLRETVEQNILAVKAGKPEGVKPLPDRIQTGKDWAPLRAALREQLKAAINGAKPLILAFGAALQSTARDWAVDLVRVEKLQAEEVSARFEPSARCRKIILCGFDLQLQIEQNYGVGIGSNPADVLFGLLDSRKK